MTLLLCSACRAGGDTNAGAGGDTNAGAGNDNANTSDGSSVDEDSDIDSDIDEGGHACCQPNEDQAEGSRQPPLSPPATKRAKTDAAMSESCQAGPSCADQSLLHAAQLPPTQGQRKAKQQQTAQHQQQQAQQGQQQCNGEQAQQALTQLLMQVAQHQGQPLPLTSQNEAIKCGAAAAGTRKDAVSATGGTC